MIAWLFCVMLLERYFLKFVKCYLPAECQFFCYWYSIRFDALANNFWASKSRTYITSLVLAWGGSRVVEFSIDLTVSFAINKATIGVNFNIDMSSAINNWLYSLNFCHLSCNMKALGCISCKTTNFRGCFHEFIRTVLAFNHLVPCCIIGMSYFI